MNKFEFDQNVARFDEYKRFYRQDGWFLTFETGEVCYTHYDPDPSGRMHFPKYGVAIFMVGDSHAPKLFTQEGKAVPTAQLTTGGAPYLVWDHATKRVVGLNTLRNNPQVPVPLQRHGSVVAETCGRD